MAPSQRTTLAAFAAGAAGFVVLFALGVNWPLAAILGAVLAASVWFTVNHLAPSDMQSEVERNFGEIEQAAARIRAMSARVDDKKTAAALRAGCDGIPAMLALIRRRDVAVALPLSERSRAYVVTVAQALEDYIDVQDTGVPEYLRLGRQELRRFPDFTSQPDKDLTARQMDEYINSVTALNLTPPPELS